MKKIVFTFIIFAFIANASAQFKVNSLGQVGNGTAIGPINDVPLIFKVDTVLAGSTGSYINTNVSFGYGSIANPLPSWLCNTAIGHSTLYFNTNGSCNTATGYKALYSNQTGQYNSATGTGALRFNTTGSDNTANGSYALADNMIGISNTANGANSLRLNTIGNGNAAIGYTALYSNTTGNYNTAIGTYALSSNETGSSNTAIGYWANVTVANLTNTTAIGHGAKVDGSNEVVIGNSYVTSIGGQVGWSNLSDGRVKKNIRENVPGLAFINSLQAVTYNLDLDAVDELQKSDDPQINAFEDSVRIARSPKEKEIEAKARANKEKQVYSGFIAQDVEKTAKSIGYNFSGVDAPENGKGAYGLRYAEFVVPLVKAVQELSEQNDRLQKQVNELSKLVYQQLGKEANELRSENSDKSVTELQDPTINGASLEQNIPNPFSERTTIRYSLPESVKTADIYIFNMQGNIVKKIAADRSGSIEIQGSELQAGMYLYSLVADGKEVDTKRMILTK